MTARTHNSCVLYMCIYVVRICRFVNNLFMFSLSSRRRRFVDTDAVHDFYTFGIDVPLL